MPKEYKLNEAEHRRLLKILFDKKKIDESIRADIKRIQKLNSKAVNERN